MRVGNGVEVMFREYGNVLFVLVAAFQGVEIVGVFYFFFSEAGLSAKSDGI